MGQYEKSKIVLKEWRACSCPDVIQAILGFDNGSAIGLSSSGVYFHDATLEVLATNNQGDGDFCKFGPSSYINIDQRNYAIFEQVTISGSRSLSFEVTILDNNDNVVYQKTDPCSVSNSWNPVYYFRFMEGVIVGTG